MFLPKLPEGEKILILFVQGLALVPGDDWEFAEDGGIDLKLKQGSLAFAKPMLLTQSERNVVICKTWVLEGNELDGYYWVERWGT